MGRDEKSATDPAPVMFGGVMCLKREVKTLETLAPSASAMQMISIVSVWVSYLIKLRIRFFCTKWMAVYRFSMGSTRELRHQRNAYSAPPTSTRMSTSEPRPISSQAHPVQRSEKTGLMCAKMASKEVLTREAFRDLWLFWFHRMKRACTSCFIIYFVLYLLLNNLNGLFKLLKLFEIICTCRSW